MHLEPYRGSAERGNARGERRTPYNSVSVKGEEMLLG